ncbi:MAG: twin-arginine translocase subunit TatC [Actinomycetota bacterium]
MRIPFRRTDKKTPGVGPDGEMTLVGHLSELRTRLIRSVVAVVAAAIVVYAFFNPIFDFLQEPYCQFQADNGASFDELGLGSTGSDVDEECGLLVTAPLESFNVRLTLAGYGGLILATPVVLYQLGRFVMPGLYPHERKALIPFVAISVLLLAGGMVVAYLLLPRALGVLSDFGSDTFISFFSPSEYLGFFVKMLFAFGVAAELPLVLIFLQKIGLVRPETLAKNRRLAIVAVVILGAVITPTGDPFTLGVITIPMYLFYEIAILVGKRLKPIGSGTGMAATGTA